MGKRDLPPVHPGEVLLEDFLKPLGISRYRLAKSIGVPQRRIDEVCAGKRAITVDTALRLAQFFGTDARTELDEPAGRVRTGMCGRSGPADQARSETFQARGLIKSRYVVRGARKKLKA